MGVNLLRISISITNFLSNLFRNFAQANNPPTFWYHSKFRIHKFAVLEWLEIHKPRLEQRLCLLL